MTGYRIEPLARSHAIDAFDCGQESLNRFLIRYALQAQHANASRTYLGLADDEIIGFYTLVVGEVRHADAPERVSKGLARHPVPIMVLARLAVSAGWQGKGIGAGLLKDALRRTLQAAGIAGIRAIVVHAKDEAARAFYEKFGFTASPADPLHLFLLTKAVERLIAKPVP